MKPNSDKRWLIPIILITAATLVIYAVFLTLDLHNGWKTDTYQITVEQENELSSPIDGTSVTDNTSADNNTTIDSNASDTSDIPSTDNTTPDSSILHATDVPEGSYIGNKNSEKYHRFDCEYGAKVQDNNLIVFDTLEDAINSGYKPCGACHPDKE